MNAIVAGFLRDLAFAQTSEQKAIGYKRAAAAVFALEQPLSDLVRSDRTLPKILGVGPASTRLILEVLETGASPTVESSVSQSSRAADIARRRALRDNFLSRAAVVRTLDNRTLKEPGHSAYRGDFQMHSEWSDGRDTLEAIAEACIARGYSHAAVTDHSYGLKIAGGMSMAEAAQQHQEIDRVNAAHGSSFRLIKGIEANIAADGSLDLAAGEIAQFELVLAAPHSKLRAPDDQTDRLIRAVETPGVHILAHPRGRITGSRAGVQADWDRVFTAATAHGVAVEIDGDPSRQDLDYTLAARALEAGCLFSLDSDAHTTSQLRFAETAIAHARLARIPADRILNYWDTDRLLDWLNRKAAR